MKKTDHDINYGEIDAKKNSLFYLIIKRLFDIVFGLLGTILFIPILIFVKIAYVCTGDFYPVIFRQARIGKNGKTIRMFKFRSMVPNADDLLKEILEKDPKMAKEYKENKKLKNDPRITKVGAFIRKASIDETPQFINVLFGSMSLIGPRPYLHREIEDMGMYYDDIITVKPGITGYWQVNGRSDSSFANRLKYDLHYIEKHGIKEDIKIFFKTFRALLKGI